MRHPVGAATDGQNDRMNSSAPCSGAANRWVVVVNEVSQFEIDFAVLSPVSPPNDAIAPIRSIHSCLN